MTQFLGRLKDLLKRFLRLPFALLLLLLLLLLLCALQDLGRRSPGAAHCFAYISFNSFLDYNNIRLGTAINVRAQAREKKKVFGTRHAIFTFPLWLHALQDETLQTQLRASRLYNVAFSCSKTFW
uniref:Uncharacterized protein n=1 Tax=Trichogramma kaykai TaxID=54128 RepID=A0ABD2VXC7_9HYME